jgi:hypothetical protein
VEPVSEKKRGQVPMDTSARKPMKDNWNKLNGYRHQKTGEAK